MDTSVYDMADLLRIMERLRDPEHGCPWDREQDFQSIVPSTLEECYELAAAIEAADYPHLADELGDVLFQVVFYAQLGREAGLFTFEEVVHGLSAKLLRRHPHVFAEGRIEGVVTSATDADRVKESWEAIKAEERAGKSQLGALDDVPVALPALPRAQKLQKRAARVGFDWPDTGGVFEKLQEEMAELREAVEQKDRDAVEDELGDVFFTLVNLTRHLRLDAESSLRRASSKFEARFRAMEIASREAGKDLADLDATELEGLWDQVKASPVNPT